MYNEVFTLPADEWAEIVLQQLQEFSGDLDSYADGDLLLDLSGDCLYMGHLLSSQLALTFYFYGFEIPVENRHLKIVFTLL